MEITDMKTIDAVQAEEVQEARETAQAAPTGRAVTAADILARIDRITEQGERLFTVIGQIRDLPVNEAPNGGEDGAQRAIAIRMICAAREGTNQKVVDLLSRMYDDIAPRRLDGHGRKIEILDQIRQMKFDAVHPEAVRELISFFERQLQDD